MRMVSESEAASRSESMTRMTCGHSQRCVEVGHRWDVDHRRDSTTGTQEGGRSKTSEEADVDIPQSRETSFHPFSDNLRLHGIILRGPTSVRTIPTLSRLARRWRCPGRRESASPTSVDQIRHRRGHQAQGGMVVVENDEVLLFGVAKHGIRDVSSFERGRQEEGDSSAVRSDFTTELRGRA